MEDFCEDSLLDFNTTWDTPNPEVSYCLKRSIFVLIPAILSLLSLLSSLTALARNGKIRKRTAPDGWSTILIVKIVLLLVLLIVHLVQMFMEFTNESPLPLDAFYFGITIFIIISNILIEFIHKRLHVYSTGLQFFFWLLQVIFYIPVVKQRIESLIEQEEVVVSALALAVFFLHLSLLVCQWWANWSTALPSEEENSFASRLIFSWLDSTFFTGYKKTLVIEEFPKPHKKVSVNLILKQFYKFYKPESIAKGTENKSFAKENNTVLSSDSNDKPKKISTLKILIKSFGGTFLFGGFLRLINDILLYGSPRIFRFIIKTIEEKDHAWKGYFWVVVLFLNAMAQVTVSNHYFRQTFVAAFQMRTAVVSAIYRKTLTVSNNSKKEFSTGQITNLMSIDAQRFLEIVPYLNVIWSGPFQLILAIYFLYDLVGVSSFVGLGVFAILVPINMWGGTVARKIQTVQMKAKDERILLMNEILQGMKVLKLYAWEKPFMGKVTESREREIHSIKKAALVQAGLWITFTGAPLVVTICTFICYILIDPKNTLTAEKVFGTVAVFNIVRIPMNQFPRFVGEAVKLLVSLQRINGFLNCEDLDISSTRTVEKAENAIEFKEGSFSWNNDSESPTLSGINLKVKSGELVAVVGKIGSGKTSFLSALLGEIGKTDGSVKVDGNISYVGQQAWIQNMTLRDNILFGKEFRKETYDKVVEACALATDLNILPSGDQTEIGENGINLSGGQKQRVGLARAAYENSDIVLLDDPLSAVDAHVGKHLFTKMIGPQGILKNRTRILVTHNLSFLDSVDRIILLDNGKIVEEGTLKELRENKQSSFNEFSQYIAQQKKVEEVIKEETDIVKETKPEIIKQSNGKLIEKEKSAEGRVSIKHYSYYLRAMNIPSFILIIILLMCLEACKVGGNVILALWTDNADQDNQWTYIGYYSLLALACSTSGMIAQIVIAFRMAAASTKIHRSLLDKTMHAPLSFFETNPIGRILNRFTSDIDVIDAKIPRQLNSFLNCLSMMLGTFVVISTVTPFVLIALLPIGIIYVFLQVYYTRTRRQITRLASVNKSPIFSHFTESIVGATTIRAFQQQERFYKESEDRVATHLHLNYISDMTNRWLSIRVEYLGNFIVFFAAMFAFYSRDQLSAGIVALSISYSMQMIDGFGWTIRMAGELESDSVALERVREYENLPQESSWDTQGGIPEDWPTSGQFSFEDYCTRYRPELPPVMENFNLNVPDQFKVAIVGRTGAGKSSLTLALFRIIEPYSGHLEMSGRDLSKVGLQDLRSRITIIPQEPTLFSGSLRFNLDPGQSYSDEEVMKAVNNAGMGDLVASLDGGLDHLMSESGLSLGQQQLVCLARALLRRSRILVLDEATAAMDAVTDSLIQETIRREFKSCTVITIAHRINTVLGADQVVVMDKGEVVEKGSPAQLLEDPSSRFYDMAKAAGVV